MRTSKPFSTISYNSDKYITSKLNDLVSAGKISFWCAIRHKPESDEKKAHLHVYINPSCMFQTDDLKCYLAEVDPENPNQPLTCITARSSKTFDDWVLYALHDKRYLASKGLSREHHYNRNALFSSDVNELDMLFNEVDMCKYTVYQTLLDFKQEGKTFEQFLMTGQCPIQQIRNYAFAWTLLDPVACIRQEPTHTPIDEPQNLLFDSETGEILGSVSEFEDFS